MINTNKNFIAVGGNRLARGLTLESLTISYFLRTSRMYDTLLQMGRWFGYRDNYLDLCRIYTTGQIITAYRHIALATRELKDEFDHMYTANEKPKTWGLKIRSHPGLLLVTGHGKSHWATNASISFDAKLLQSHNTMINKDDCIHNFKAINDAFFSKYNFEITDNKVAYINNDVSADDVKDFIRNYKIGPSHSWRPKLVRDYISNRNQKDELTTWSVAILNSQRKDNDRSYSRLEIEHKDTKKHLEGIGDVTLTLRNGKISESKNYISLDKAVISQSHEKIDFPKGIGSGKENNPENTPAEVREKRSKKRGLILLYPLFGKTVSDNDLPIDERVDL